MGDQYGRRRLFLIGLSLFAITAVVCGAAPDATVLVVGRLCRGVAAGLLAPQVIGLMQQMYTGAGRGKAFGYYGATVGLSTAIGPLLGGVILQVGRAPHAPDLVGALLCHRPLPLNQRLVSVRIFNWHPSNAQDLWIDLGEDAEGVPPRVID